jgi:hypothetical protein
MTGEWWEEPANIRDLILWLSTSEDGLPSDPRELLDWVLSLLEKPWHWSPEYEELRREKRHVRSADVDEDEDCDAY